MQKTNVVVYGIGECGKTSLHFLEGLGFRVSYFCDPYEENWGGECLGKKILSPKELAELGSDVPIFIASGHGEKIHEELLANGFSNCINPQIHKLLTEAWPDTVEVTTGIGCRVNCRFCCQKAIISAYTQQSSQMKLSLASFQRCLKTVPANVRINFCGISEPFLNKQCANMMRHAHEKGHVIWFASTLVGLSTKQCEIISEIPFRRCMLHVADSDSHSHIPVTKEYRRILAAVIAMIEKNGGNSPRHFHCHGNLHPGISDIVHDAGWPISYSIHDRAGHESDAALQHRHMHESIYCHHTGLHFRYNMLLPDGRVVLCHCDCTMRYVLGNLLEDDYESLFNSPLLAELRQKSTEHDNDILCRTCQDARREDGSNFPVWQAHRWEPFRFFVNGLITL